MRSHVATWSVALGVVSFACAAPRSENVGSQSDQAGLRDGGVGAQGANGATASHSLGADGTDDPASLGRSDEAAGAGDTGNGFGLNTSEGEGSGAMANGATAGGSNANSSAGPGVDDNTAHGSGGDSASTVAVGDGTTSADPDSTNDALTHHCEDGNDVAGDGCSPGGIIEPGYTCVTPGCESEPCSIEVAATYRDFSESEADFGFDQLSGCGELEGDPLPQGAVAAQLDADGLPVLANPAASACIQSADSFAEWYRGGVKKETTLRLYSNGEGSFVNRFGANGEQLVVTQTTREETQVAAACDAGCAQRVSAGLQCENVCRPAHDAVRARQDAVRQLENQRAQLQAMLELEQAAAEPDVELIAELSASLSETDTELDALNLAVLTKIDEAAACDVECESNYDAQVAACVADCKPCSFSPGLNCTGGLEVYFDGTPVFFPVDDITGATSDLYPAHLADYYGYNGWPAEDSVFPGAPSHNFFFTTELSYSFRFDPAQTQVLRFTGDDDLWVFINGKLAVDLGGIHTPASGDVVLDADAGAAYGLVSGETYTIKVFHAERTLYGSSLLVTMPGSGAHSVCTKKP